MTLPEIENLATVTEEEKQKDLLLQISLKRAAYHAGKKDWQSLVNKLKPKADVSNMTPDEYMDYVTRMFRSAGIPIKNVKTEGG